MIINLEDRLVKELDSIFDNRRTSQVEWDVCIEDIVEEYVARQRGYVDEDALEESEQDTVDTETRHGIGAKTITRTPFDAWTLLNNVKKMK
jgi:lysyl-tRNA synthetase class I